MKTQLLFPTYSLYFSMINAGALALDFILENICNQLLMLNIQILMFHMGIQAIKHPMLL